VVELVPKAEVLEQPRFSNKIIHEESSLTHRVIVRLSQAAMLFIGVKHE
jgi:hypothetical protein